MDELFTERLKLKDILPEVATDIAKEYKLKEDDIELVRKNNPLKPEDIDISDGERAAIRFINTADLDRDNEIVLPSGGQVNDFKKSPSVLYAHDYRGLPIGKDKWLKLISGKGWLAKTIYAEHELATDVYNLVKGKFLNTSSIGFIPLESVSPDKKGWDKAKGRVMDEYSIPEKIVDKARRIYTKWLLLEHSDVPVPSNINALNVAVGKGFIKSDQLIKDLEIEITDDKEDESWLIESSDAIELEAVEKPYPNEHACRLRSPGDFQPDSFRRMTRTSDGKKYSVIMGRLKGETTMTEQAYRYDIKVWTVSQARKHCKDHKGILFEPATGKEELSKQVEMQAKMRGLKLVEKKEEDKLKEIGLFDVNELYEIVEENKKLKLKVDELNKKNKELELKAGAVLNKKNKADLIEAQKRIQNVLDSAATEEGGKQTYNCECIKCGYKITSDKHCDTLKCPKCGGKMRRAERPGPGKGTDELEIEGLEIEGLAELKVEEKENQEQKDDTKGKEGTIDIDKKELIKIIHSTLEGQFIKGAENISKTLKKDIDNNFKKMTGKVM